MTIIVWDGVNLAADRNVGHDRFAEWREKKIFRHGNLLVGFTGGVLHRDVVVNWILSGKSRETTPRFEENNFQGIVIDVKNKTIDYYKDSLASYTVPYDLKIALGSLECYAKGALAVGANAQQAVHTALTVFATRPEVRFYDIDVLSSEILEEPELVVKPTVKRKKHQKEVVNVKARDINLAP